MLFTSGGERTAKGKQELKCSRIMQMCKLLCPQLEIRPPFLVSQPLMALCPCVLVSSCAKKSSGSHSYPLHQVILKPHTPGRLAQVIRVCPFSGPNTLGGTNHHARVPFLVLNLAGLSARDVGPMFWNTLNMVRPSDD